jgi:hypothetical protein
MEGGKAGRSPDPLAFLEAGYAFFEESLAPLRDDLSGRVDAGSNLIVVEAIGCIQDNLGADYISIR